MPLRGCNECHDHRRGTGGGHGNAERAERMRAVMSILAVGVADMEMRRHCQHPQAQRARQHQAEAAL